MINSEKLKIILEAYKADFSSNWKEEKFKWEVVGHFQKHWDIKAENFGAMFKLATDKAHNLLASGYAYPRQMMLNFANADGETVRQMFRDLYNESRDLAERVAAFQIASEEIRANKDDGTWKNHYQNTNSISTYLWLMFPDKYYIYKYDVCKDVAAELDSDYKIKANGSVDTMLNGFAMYDEINAVIRQDEELAKLLRDFLTDGCYSDPQFKIATVDFGFYLSRYYLKARENIKDWHPKDYTPDLSVDEWVSLLNDSSVFTLDALQIMKRMKDCGGQATCKQLSMKYGENYNFYNSNSVALARRVAGKTNCPVMMTDTEELKWWPVLYLGKKTENSNDGAFIWKLRAELSGALDKIDLSDVPLYADAAPAIWKISHGTEATGVSDENKAVFEKRNVVAIGSGTRAKGVSKITQGQLFMESVKIGDYFYLCYGSKVQLLGQITGEPVLNPEIQRDWYERKYRLIAKTKNPKPYTGAKKWWTPNDNSTCIKVDKNEEGLFEEYILKPYFDMSLSELLGDEMTVHSYPEYTKADFLSAVYMTEERYNVLESLLRNKKNVILQGAPGVGKTFTAKRLAYAMMGARDDSRIEMVQFHQNYSYEDFIMGYRPDGAEFKLTEGIFYRFCKTAATHPDKPYFFIIDEINRGNMSKIFGELLMLIEKDYRNTSITLAYNGKQFSVPENLYIIGMMNTADRSIAMIDYALRRRFGFFEIEPGFNSNGFMQYQSEFANETFNALIDRIKVLNREIIEDKSLGRGFRIGHSYFCGRKPGECTADWMRSVVEFDIIPMLEEYWFDEPANLRRWEKDLRGVFDD
ncbi:MAG: AAA family ATPase [Lachnospiraceae bacterium]|nr:AAA family ATPase [Ruminococcus sp.]MCM1275586.1 AAA family ATPase [Lachnospiraceae bacterium]